MTDNSVINTEASNQKDLLALTWNIESLKNNVFLLKEILERESVDLVFLSEPQVFQADLMQLMEYVKGDYCHFLNSADLHNPELPLLTTHATGGTMCLWKRDLDPYVSVFNPNNSSFTPVILTLPNHPVSIHIGIYLPTHGKDVEFISDLAELKICIEELTEIHPDAILFIRGDGNVNSKNKKRVILLDHFISDISLKQVLINHKTYHHFTGNGAHDSNVDILLHSSSLHNPEIVTNVLCKLDNPLILSHHDIILSKLSLPLQPERQTNHDNLVTAPRLEIVRNKITWTENGIQDYESLVSPHLQKIRENWLHPGSLCSMSILLKMTNTIMSTTATNTNSSRVLNTSFTPKSKRVPKEIITAKKHLLRLHKAQRSLQGQPTTAVTATLKSAKHKLKQSVRKSRVQAGCDRDKKLFSILEQNPRSAYNFIKSCRKSSPASIEMLTVGSKVYSGPSVADGFFDSMSSIKTCPLEKLQEDPRISEHLSNHEHILKLCKDKRTIPPIDINASSDLLNKMKKNVNDIFSITALHYLNAGGEGLAHFNFLLNAIISDVNNATLEELNLVLGLILYKGHNKLKTSDRAYRTISTCPFMAKAADLYLRDLYQHHWNSCQADTQYQGEGSNHELAALLVTEVIQYSLNVSKKPVYLLTVDAMSAFDRCLRQILSSQLYKADITGSALTFIDNRLASRATAYQWEGTMMGPAHDDTGFEQGGINSSDFYKLYNNEQLISTQRSRLGIDLKSCVISAIGQADDVVHVANSIDDLNLLVKITEDYCKKYRVTLVPSKTKLLAYANTEHEYEVYLAQLLNPIKIDNTPVKFCDETEHVGIIRNISGNLPNLLNRIICHKKSLGAILSAGLARGHRGNPAASLRVHQLYETPVLFSGLAALVLTKAEIGILDSHYLNILQNLQRLHDKTPRAVVLFMAGSLPGEAILHTRQLTLFSMICRLQGDPLHAHAHYALTCLPRSAKSWFQQLRDICLKYSLPHPLELLQHPPSKLRFKTLVKKQVTKHWEDLLRSETLDLSSLIFFQTTRLSLHHPTMLWLTAGSNSYECSKSLLVAKMQSGRYRSDYLCRHWTPSNKKGFCLSDTCHEVEGNLVHMLTLCPALKRTRDRLVTFWHKRSSASPPLNKILADVLSSPPTVQTQFILDPQMDPAVNDLCKSKKLGSEMLRHVYYLTRTFAYYMHRAKMISLGRWPGDPGRKEKALACKKTISITRGQLIINDNFTNCDQNCTVSISGPPVPSLQPPVTDVGPTSLLWHGQLSVTNPGCVTTTRVMPTHSSTTTTIRAEVVSEKAIHTEKNEAADLVPHKPDAAHRLGWLSGAGPVCAGGGAAARGSNTSSLPSSPTTL